MNTITYLPTCWRELTHVNTLGLPTSLLNWLSTQGLIKSRLQAALGHAISIHICAQSWQPILADEAAALNMSPHTEAWTREIFLVAQNRIWLFGRSVYPRSLIDKDKRFVKLGNHALGEFLTTFTDLKRSPFEFALLQKENFEYQCATQKLENFSGDLWARRSTFTIHNEPLLLTETFFPQMFDLPCFPPISN